MSLLLRLRSSRTRETEALERRVSTLQSALEHSVLIGRSLDPFRSKMPPSKSAVILRSPNLVRKTQLTWLRRWRGLDPRAFLGACYSRPHEREQRAREDRRIF
jgi:hypothetical protein